MSLTATRPGRLVLGAAVAGVVAAGAVLAAMVAAGDSGVDGEFVLDQPGIYAEPVVTSDRRGEPLPDVSLPAADGAPVGLRSLSGRPTVINVWYSACAPCAKELRDFAEVSGEHAGHIAFVGVNPRDDVDTMIEFAAERGVDYLLLRDPELALVGALRINAFPTTLFVSADGEIVHQTNALDAGELRQAIDDYLF